MRWRRWDWAWRGWRRRCWGERGRVKFKDKLKHWRALQSENGCNAAPVLEFYLLNLQFSYGSRDAAIQTLRIKWNVYY